MMNMPYRLLERPPEIVKIGQSVRQHNQRDSGAGRLIDRSIIVRG